MTDERRHIDDATGYAREEGHALSRRDFLKGAAALATVPLIASAAGCASTQKDSSAATTVQTASTSEASTEAPSVLMVSSDELVSLSDFTQNDDTSVVEAQYQLPVGAQLFMASATKAVILALGQSASPLSTIEMLDITDGTITTLRDTAVSSSEGFEIYDVRASSEALAWSECNMLTSDWRLYAATFTVDDALGRIYQLDEGDSDWDPPQFTVSGSTVLWTMMPEESGAYTSGPSYVKRADASASDVVDIYTSNGRLCTAPELSDGVITITPRHNTSGVYYDLLALDPSTLEVVSQLTLPKAVKALNAIYEQDAFAFSIEASYDSSSAISSIGTYRDLGGGSWLRVARTPACTPAWCNGRLLVKNGKGTSVIDTTDRSYYQIAAPGYSWNFGDYLAVAGTCDKLVTYATVDANTDVTSAYVLVRVITV